MENHLVDLIADLREDEALALVKQRLDGGSDPVQILDQARAAMDLVGKRFEASQYFIPDLVMAGEILRGISDTVKPRLEWGQEAAKKGKVLIGTVAGDIHDIGKDIVTFMLDMNGFDVLDLGIDVPPEVFVEQMKAFKPQVVGLSGFLTLAFDSMKKTIETLEQAGLRKEVKVMIGGGQIDDVICKYVRADAYGKDAIAAVNLSRKWIGGQS
jgi:5-methyltetrahydrofolate--homocysteine methyltransferase